MKHESTRRQLSFVFIASFVVVAATWPNAAVHATSCTRGGAGFKLTRVKVEADDGGESQSQHTHWPETGTLFVRADDFSGETFSMEIRLGNSTTVVKFNK